jgi:FtsZ-interacting cell division protein YlmF
MFNQEKTKRLVPKLCQQLISSHHIFNKIKHQKKKNKPTTKQNKTIVQSHSNSNNTKQRPNHTLKRNSTHTRNISQNSEKTTTTQPKTFAVVKDAMRELKNGLSFLLGFISSRTKHTDVPLTPRDK